MLQFVKGEACIFRGGDDALKRKVRAITTEEEVDDLVNAIEAYAKAQGCYTGALADATLKKVVSYGNSFVNETLGMYTTASV